MTVSFPKRHRVRVEAGRFPVHLDQYEQSGQCKDSDSQKKPFHGIQRKMGTVYITWRLLRKRNSMQSL
jgi:hypothetical protein